MTKNILVFTEISDGKVRNVALETIFAALEIAQGGSVSAVVLGAKKPDNLEILDYCGLDKIILVEIKALELFTSDAFSQALIQVIDAEQPDAILLGHTSIGKELAPRIAAMLKSGLISDCTAISAVEDLLFTRPIYAGKAFERRRVTDGIILATIRPNNFPVPDTNTSKSAEVNRLQVNISSLRTVITNVVRKTADTIDLTEAKIIVSGGRGVKSAEGFKPLRDLAEVLGAAVGASRGACDQQYADYSVQIGQTGKVVTPDIYIACGISGAIQHLAGMSNSKVIVAINTDPEAPIFKVADYGIVGDLFEVVPMLTEEFKQILVNT